MAVDVPDGDCQTSGKALAEETMVEELLIGRWQHVDESGWYRVYTSEPAGEGYCWGREWDTSEDIYEKDLRPYGNGWFKWKKEGEDLVEVHVTDLAGAVVQRSYKMLKLDGQVMKYREQLDSEKHLFRKIGD